MDPCPVCGEDAVIEDRSGEEYFTVCGECGSVLSEFNLTAGDGTVESGYQHASNAVDNMYAIAPRHTKVQEPWSEGKSVGKKCANDVCGKLNYPKQMTDCVCSLYFEVIKHKEICDKSIENKKLVCYACIYIIGRTFDQPVTLKEFCGISNVSVYKVAAFVKTILRLQNITLPYQSIGSLTVHILSKVKLEYLHGCVIQVLRVCDKLWLSTGRHRDILIIVASYFAWVSNNFVQNKSVSMKSFCKQFKFTYCYTMRERYNELMEILTTLTNKLPWALNKGKKDFVFINLNDTLRYQKSLIYSSSSKIDSSDSDESSSSDEKNPGKIHKRQMNDPEKENQEFLPPSRKKSKRGESFETELGTNYDTCLSDSEEYHEKIDLDIEKYIRTEDEVKELVKSLQTDTDE